VNADRKITERENRMSSLDLKAKYTEPFPIPDLAAMSETDVLTKEYRWKSSRAAFLMASLDTDDFLQ
jgi:hypothetical protein